MRQFVHSFSNKYTFLRSKCLPFCKVYFYGKRKHLFKKQPNTQYIFSWDPRQILYFCILNILKYVFNMYLKIFFLLLIFSISWTPQKRSRYKTIDTTKTKRQVLCLKGVRGHQIIKRAEYSSSTCKHAFEQCFICIVLSFCWMTLWPVGFNYKH